MSDTSDIQALRAAVGVVPEGVTDVFLPPTARAAKGGQYASAKAADPAVAAIAASYYEDNPDRLHGDRPPAMTITQERPIHRTMIWMHAQGATGKDIALQTGYDPAYVTQVLRQPWARSRLLQILKESGQDQVKHFLTHEVAPSLEVLRDVRDNPLAKNSDRITASREILDRALGKATVHVESVNTNKNVPADLQRIEAEIAAINSQLEGKGVN